MLEQAIALANQGFHIFPLYPGTKKPGFKDWETIATTDLGEITRWWKHMPEANIAIACGPSNLLVVDLDKAKKPDGPQHGQQTLAALAAGRELPRTLTVASARGGRHLYFRQPEGVALRNTAGSGKAGLGPLIDTRGHGGFIVAPGSVFEGGSYLVEDQAPIASLPSWIVDELAKRRSATPPAPSRTPVAERRRSAYADTALNRSSDAVAAAPEGTRNDTLNREAFRMGRLVGGGVLQPNDVESELRRAAHQAGLPFDEAANTIASGMSAGISHPRSIPDRDRLPQIRQQPEDGAMSVTQAGVVPAEMPDQVPSAVDPTPPPETFVEPHQAEAREDEVGDIWSDLRTSFGRVHQVLRDWVGDDVDDGLEPATDEVAELVARTVVERSQDNDASPYDEAPAFVESVDTAVADARTAGVSPKGPEWTGISAIRDAIHNLWDTVKAVAGRYWAELSADIRVTGPLKSLATRAARGFADLASRAAEHLEQRGAQQQRRVDSLASLREAYIDARGQVRAHAAAHEWQRISALWGTVNTLARQTADPGIRAVVARSADAIADHAGALSLRVAPDVQAGAAGALTALAEAAERHAGALRAVDVNQLSGAGPSAALRQSASAGVKGTAGAPQQGGDPLTLQTKAHEVAQLAQARLNTMAIAEAVPRSPHGSNRTGGQQGDLLRYRPLVSPQETVRGPRR